MVLSQVINQLANSNPASNRRRRLYIPPSTNYPLFSYGAADDQRSFLSLDESGSVFTDQDDASDVVSIASSRSLPSSLNSTQTNEDQETFHEWLLEEHHRRYSAIDDDDAFNERRSRRSHASLPTSKSGRILEGEDFARMKTTYSREIRTLLRYSFPLIITFLLEHFFSIVCLLVVGHLGKTELAAVSLGSMTSTISLAIFEGTATALDTLCPQAFGGGHFDLVCIHVQRCYAFSILLFIPVALFWWNSHLVLQFAIKDAEVLKLTSLFLRIMIPGGPAYIFFECSKRFLQCQGIFEAGTGVLFVSAPINIFMSWFLVWNKTFGIGFAGAPIATVINFYLMAFLLIMYVRYIDGSKCWTGLCSWAILFQKWGQLIHLAIPGIVMLESEYIAYEIMTLIALYFGTTELAAQSAVASIASLTYMVPFAVSIAASTRIANFIGASNRYSAKISTYTGLLIGLGVASLNGLVLWSARDFIARIFTKDEEVIEVITLLFNPLVAILEIFDGTASVASGILRAQGRQKIGGLINFLSYYAFAMPLALALSKLLDWELFGLWVGIGSGMILIALSETLFIVFSDWDSILMKAGLMNDSDSDEEF